MHVNVKLVWPIKHWQACWKAAIATARVRDLMPGYWHGVLLSACGWLQELPPVNVKVSSLRAKPERDLYNSDEPGPQATRWGLPPWKPSSDNCTQLTGCPTVLSRVATCKCVRNPGGHAESSPGPSKATSTRGQQEVLQAPINRHHFHPLHNYIPSTSTQFPDSPQQMIDASKH